MFLLLSRYWWVLVLRGVVAVIFGLVGLAAPGSTLAVLVFAFGAYALIDGVAYGVAGLGGRHVTDDWWMVVLHGVLGIVVGALMLASPGLTAVALLLYVAAWAIVVGVLQIVAAIRLRRELTGEWWLVAGGTLSVLFGLLMVRDPGAGALTLLWLIALYALAWGVALIVAGLAVRRGRTLVTSRMKAAGH